jgi:hypothetical protein
MEMMSRRAMPRLGGIIVIVVMGLAWSLPIHTYAQTIKVRGKSEQARFVARSEVPLGGMVMGRLESLFRVLKSNDPAWNGAQVFSVRFSDPEMRQNGTMRGQMVVIHSDGARAFLEYEVTWKPGSVDTEFDVIGRFLQGTGKFAGVRGRWTERGISTMTEDSSEWEVEYSLPGS